VLGFVSLLSLLILAPRREAGLKFRIVRGCGQEYADTPHPLQLLRTRRERPRGHTAEERG
jgi:hypothetical protein